MISGRGPFDPATEQDQQLLTYPYVWVRIGCAVCNKPRRFRLTKLVDTFGAEISMSVLLDRLTINCPWRQDLNYKGRVKQALTYEPCGARFIDLDPPQPPPDDPGAAARPKLRVVPSADDLVRPRRLKELKRALRG